jgi:digeranylgeranylglycerophospholipid reductase
LNDYDVIVVGGGCSGLWAATVAAGEGASTLLVERCARIGERIVCAEGVGAVGIGQFIDLKPEWIASRVDGAKLFTPDGRCVDIEEPACGFVLYKDRLLVGLSERASEEGVEIWTGSEATGLRPLESGGIEVDIQHRDGRCRLRCGGLVGADGIEARLGRQVGVQSSLAPGDLFSCAQSTVAAIEMDPGKVEFHFGRDVAPGGYAWVFPKGESVANVGVGTVCDADVKVAPADYLNRFMDERCGQAKVLNRIFGGVPSVKSPFKAFGKGVFLAGDSARVADPVSGAGIVLGMESAAVAGRAASAYSRNGSDGSCRTEKTFVRDLRALFKDRRLRFAVRRILTRMNDKELSRMIELTGEYASEASFLKGDPFKVMRFLAKAMPKTFGLIRHLVGV